MPLSMLARARGFGLSPRRGAVLYSDGAAGGVWVPKMSSGLLARDDAYRDPLFPTAARRLLIWYDQEWDRASAPLGRLCSSPRSS